MSLLFSKDEILLVNRKLAALIGLNEAIVLQQIHYWIKKKGGGVEHAGSRWVFNSLDRWHEQFPFWSPDTIKRTLAALKSKGLVKVEKLSEVGRDRTNYYTIDYAQIALMEAGNLHQCIGANCTNGSGQSAPMDQGKLHQSISANCTDDCIDTKTTTKTTTKNITAKADAMAEPMRVTDKKGVVHEIPADLRYPGSKTKTHDAWCAYAIAYRTRHGAWPVWNATVAGQVSQFIDRVGAERAPRVAYHYVAKVQEPFVVKQMHPVKLLLSDAEKWATQCQTGAAGVPAAPDAPTETFAQRAARQRMEEVAPGVARKPPGAESGFEAAQRFIAGGPVIDVPAREAAPRIEGAAA